MKNVNFKIISLTLWIFIFNLSLCSQLSAIDINGIEFPEGAVSFADIVFSYTPGEGVDSPYNDPSKSIGLPDWNPQGDAVTNLSLGTGGIVILKFMDNSLTTSGDESADLWIFEASSSSLGSNTIEPVSVEISTDAINWISVGSITGDTSGIDIDQYVSNGIVQGVKYRFVRITDLPPETTEFPWAGADIDAVGAISSAPPIINDGLIAYYPFDGNVNDEGTKRSDGNEYSISYISGKLGQAASFDGIKSYISLPKDSFWPVINDFSVSFWILPTEPHEIDQESNSTYNCEGAKNQKYAFIPLHGGDRYNAGFGVSVGTNGISVYEHADNYIAPVLVWEGTIKNDEWSHIVIVYNDRQPHLYINGKLTKIGLKSKISQVHLTNGIGKFAYGNFKGSIDEVFFYNRKITISEITDIYSCEYSFPTERKALIDLYYSTEGNNWNFNVKWLDAPGSECSWYGITCDESKHIKDIHLFNNNLSGSIPSSIINLKYLRSLLVHNNKLTGDMPNEIFQLEYLEAITLNDNELTNASIFALCKKYIEQQDVTEKLELKDVIIALKILSGFIQ